jgi:diadenylate cyclase
LKAPLPILLGQLPIGLRAADLLDIAIVGVLLYLILQWFRRRGSRALVVGAILLALLHLAADRFDMVLTSMLLELGFTAALLALIVVFQNDIRRGFERLSTWSHFVTERRIDETVTDIDSLGKCLETLAENRIGALLVFVGREPIEPHVSGGVPVNGLISSPLLHSIFHPSSPGHDGAVVIDEGRIEMLGAHLPLSTNREEIGNAGTRHAAALGLSERSDACIIAVSEERGTIGLAEKGELKQISPGELIPLLERLHGRRAPVSRKGPISWLSRDMAGKTFSLTLAVVFWLLLAYRADTVQRTYVVPIEYRKAPEGYVIEDEGPNLAEVRLSGTERAFGLLNALTLAVSADVSEVGADSYQFVSLKAPDDLPSGLTVISIEPRTVPVALKRSSLNQVP